ncbi:MAG: quinolinate synthase NadA [Deltaproteobacteria bacterium]|nr:quinolinate synthase NadA [Deltaproteobacteria bacterium]
METDRTIREIERLKAARRAVILAHNYQESDVQDVADFVGDSLELSQKAAATPAEVIVFCGVHFMAETAFLLSPEKTVLLPRAAAGCPMADMITPDGLAAMRDAHPGAAVVCYVNSSAAVKALSDICCTSANAERVVRSIPEDREIVFVPDKYLGRHVERRTGRSMVLWPGFCPIHARLEALDVRRARSAHPGAEVWAHPECRPEVSDAADFVLSTGGMVRRARETKSATVVVATEVGMLHRLRAERPDVTFVAASEAALCTNMKMTGLRDVLAALETMRGAITVPDEVREPAARAVARMLEVG